MAIFYTILASLQIIAGLIGTLTILTMLMLAGANSSEAEIRTIKRLLLLTVVLGLGFAGGGILLMIRQNPVLAGLVGIAPLLFVIGAVIWLGVQQALR